MAGGKEEEENGEKDGRKEFGHATTDNGSGVAISKLNGEEKRVLLVNVSPDKFWAKFGCLSRICPCPGIVHYMSHF